MNPSVPWSVPHKIKKALITSAIKAFNKFFVTWIGFEPMTLSLEG